MMEYITTAQAAKIYGINRHYAARLAKRSHELGNEWPIKSGRTWLAPVNEWEKILNPKGIYIRKKRQKVLNNEGRSMSPLVSASEAARCFGYCKSWVSTLARKSVENGYEWPKKVGNMWMAPVEKWEEILFSTKLKQTTYRKKFKK